MLAPSNFFRFVQTSICIALIAVVCVGCGKPKPVPANEAPASDTGEIKFRSTEEAQQALAGVWVGGAVLNEETLNRLLAEMAEPQRQALLKESQTFATTQMAIEMVADGNMQTAIEIRPVDAETIQGQTIAQWSVAEVEGSQILVKALHQDKTGETKTSHMLYNMSPDGNRIVMQSNVGGPLKQCEPLIYLDRQADERAAETDSAMR